MLGEFNAVETYSDFCNLRFRISKRSNISGWRSATRLKLKQRPFIVVEFCVIFDAYIVLVYREEAEVLMMKLKRVSQALHGNFVLLCHNSELYNKNQVNVFKKILKN